MYRKNLANQNLGFVLVNAATGAALTGATVTAYRVVDNGAQVPATGTVNEKGNGQYSFAASAADTNGNQISFLFAAPGAVPVEKTIVTTMANPTDAQAFGLSALPVAGTLAVKPAVTLAAADVTGNLPVDLQTIKTFVVSAPVGGVTFPTTLGSSVYSGSDTTGTSTLLGLLTAQRAANLDRLDASVSLIKAKTDNLPPNPAAVGSPMSVTGTVQLAANGLDLIPVETGVNARQALSPILAAAAGVLIGAGTGTVIIKGGNVATTRITAATDNAGNRTGVSLNIPA